MRLNKRAQLLKFADSNKCILCTHSLFMAIKKEDFKLFEDYILILDEVIDPLGIKYIGAQDIEIFRKQNIILIEEATDKVRFIDDEYKDSGFKVVKQMCQNNSVFHLNRGFFAWIFPPEIFKEFSKVEVLTYLFEGSLLCAYFKLFEIRYKIFKKDERPLLNTYKDLLNIYKGPVNYEKSKMNSFSVSWAKNLSKKESQRIKHATSNIFKRNFKTKSKSNAYTAFKESKSKFSGNSYSKGFIPVNSRATNDFRHIESMAYLANRYLNPQQVNFFHERGIELNQDLWALGEMLQWIWRGCIRDKKKLNLFIPNYRMRTLLYKWLNGECY